MDSELTFSKHVEKIVTKANSLFGMVKRYSRELDDPYTIIAIYNGLVRTTIEYASVVWRPIYNVYINRIERVQKKFVRYAVRNLGWRDEMPDYRSLCLLVGINSLSDRRILIDVLFLKDVVSGKYSAPYLCSQVTNYEEFKNIIRKRDHKQAKCLILAGMFELPNSTAVTQKISIPTGNPTKYAQVDTFGRPNVRVDKHQEELTRRIRELEKVIAELNKTTNPPSSTDVATRTVVGPPDAIYSPAGLGISEQSLPSIRWDNMKPFPKGIPANKMWEAWTKYLENFEIAASLSNAHDPVRRVQLLFLSIGEELQGIVRTAKLRPSMDDPNCYSTFTNNIEQHLKSMTDTSAEHDAFLVMKQVDGESAVSFHARLMEKVWLCGYSTVDQDRHVRTQLLKGLRNRKLARASRIYGYDTNFIVQSATRDEAFPLNEPAVTDGTVAINQVYRRESVRQPKRRNNGPAEFEPRTKRFHNERPFPPGRRSRCPRCDLLAHKYGRCPAFDKNCNSCGRQGHFAAACRRNRVNTIQGRRVQSETINEDKYEQVNTLSLGDVLINCRLGSSSPIRFLIDSGADVNIVAGHDWDHLNEQRKLGMVNLESIDIPRKSLHAYAISKPILIANAFRAEVQVDHSNKPVVTADFFVVREGRQSLLGRSTASDMGLLKIGSSINNCEFQSDVFPKMPGVKVRFSVDRSVAPVRNAYYNVPAAYRDGARKRLQEMESRGIIERVTSAPVWISGMSAVAKGKDDFRLVVNMRAPNKAIKREYFRLPLIEEIKVKLHGAKYFSKLDLSNAFYHLELCKESRDLTTFLTENGMFRFTRLMFGVNCAPEIFQREMSRILEKIENKVVYIDDVLLFGGTLEELRSTVSQVLRILRQNNLTLNTAKCEFDRTCLKFIGHDLDEKGFHINEQKIKDIRKFRSPVNASELRSFLGLASFVSPYIKNFADISAPLWPIVTAKSWNWGETHEKAFELVKDRIVHCTVSLGYFSERDKTILYTDASPNALGAVLAQKSSDRSSRIISFASKALTETEKKYAQNQREALAAVWAVEYFSYFLLGRYFVLRTDAAGITFILNRHRENSKRALTRADGWALRLTPYNYDVEYVRGRDNIADPSSRLYEGSSEPFDEDSSPWEIARLEANTITFLTDEEVKNATASDETLQRVSDALETGNWPKELRKFHAISEYLSKRDGIIIKSGCAVIPENLRNKTLEMAHSGHPLAAKFKSILRERVWWPGMSEDAEQWVRSCSACAVNGKPEKPTPWNARLPQKRSRYAITRPVKSTSFTNTRKILDEVFDREGFPEAIKTDNGPPFNGEEYKQYCASRGIRTIFSTPFFPQQNGLAESFMKVVNRAMSTACTNGTSYVEELQAAVHAYNAATHSITKFPPEEIMLGRKVKRGLPLISRGKTNHDDEVFNDRDREAKLRSKEREDKRRGAKRSAVKPGDTVIIERQLRAKGDSRFDIKRYTVTEENNGSLLLTDEEGRILKRHVSQVKKVYQWREKSPEHIDKSRQIPVESEHDQRLQRPRKVPSYLSDYVSCIQDMWF
ncbi:uncharacterized protein K02A2.6-like [Sabethes cyaneus]|uniref:uncharacterized protein K02A2.6-like n=1 Tax=Sabethes cyaneus TaxID=53552 RepID=UPI00237E36A7|nr:uncharacterized protein K02A2.6-like [Sabethes cyaneus]